MTWFWSEFQSSTAQYLAEVQKTSDFSDVTLVCEDGEPVWAHRMVMSAGSSFFERVLRRAGSHPQPLVVLRGVLRQELEQVLSFLYRGETSIHQRDLDSFLQLARYLGVRGLAEEEVEAMEEETNVVEIVKRTEYDFKKEQENETDASSSVCEFTEIIDDTKLRFPNSKEARGDEIKDNQILKTHKNNILYEKLDEHTKKNKKIVPGNVQEI